MPDTTIIRPAGHANGLLLAQVNERPGVAPQPLAPVEENIDNPQQRQPARPERSLFGKILYEGFKIGLTIGLSVIASTFLGPLGGMIVGGLVTAAFSAIEQHNEKGQIDLTRVAIEFGLGFISIGVGKVVTKAAGKFITKATEKPLLSAAIISGAQGGFTGASLTAYDTYTEHGEIDWSSVGLSFVIGGAVGAGMGAGMHKISSKFSKKIKPSKEPHENSQTSENILINEARRKEMKILAQELYDKEILSLAQRLGVSPTNLRRIMPRITFIDKSNFSYIFLENHIGGFYSTKFKFIFNLPTSLLYHGTTNYTPGVAYRSSLKDFVHSLVAHETRHIEQFIIPLCTLSRKEYVSLAIKEFLKSIQARGDIKVNPVSRFFARLAVTVRATLEYNQKYKFLLQKSGIGSAVKDKNKALEMLANNIDGLTATMYVNKSLSGYLNSNYEVDARMYSFLSRLLSLRANIGSPNHNLTSIPDRLGLIRYELFHETDGLRHPTTKPLQDLLASINFQIEQIRLRLGL